MVVARDEHMTRIRQRISAGIGWLAIVSMAWISLHAAQEVEGNAASDDPLLREIDQWKDRFEPVTAEMVAAKRQQVIQAASHLQQFLARGGRKVVDGWNRYLHWDVLERELRSETPDLQALNQVLQALYSDTPGVEYAQFRQLRSALHQFMNARLVASTPAITDQYRSQLSALAEAIVRYRQSDTQENAEAVGRCLGWLDDAGQARPLVAKVRQELAKPNFVAHVSARVAQASAAERVDEVLQLSDCILGTSIQGTAHTVGDVQVELLPSESAATLAIRLVGTARSRNVGTNRGVLIYSAGHTDIDARKEIRVDADGIHTSPAVAECQTATQITGVWHRLCLVRKIAWQQAQRQRPQAEQIANVRAEQRVARQMDDRAEQMLDEAKQAYLEKFRNPLLRRGEFPQQVVFTSTPHQLGLTILQANSNQIAAPVAPPDIPADLDLSLRIHESFVGNFSEATIGGYTLTDERLVQILEENKREVPEELRIDPTKDPWSITFAARQPVRVEFRNQMLKVTIRGRQFTRGNQTVTAEMDIWAVYRVDRTPDGLKLTRQGEVQAEYTRGGFENAARIAVKTLMRKKFEALFTEEFAGQGIELSRRSSTDTERSQAQKQPARLKLAHLDVSNGWLSMGWTLVPPPKTASTTATSATAPSDS